MAMYCKVTSNAMLENMLTKISSFQTSFSQIDRRGSEQAMSRARYACRLVLLKNAPQQSELPPLLRGRPGNHTESSSEFARFPFTQRKSFSFA